MKGFYKVIANNNLGAITISDKEIEAFTFIVSIGCNKEVESADARPPAKADFKTFSADISTGGGTATTVAASNHTFLNVCESKHKR